jgi:16S rRNA (adenine1518-N6/adenine1519-N6)-dimethyltransferase
VNPTRPSDVAALLQALDFHPSRLLGQNFLVDGNILSIILEAAAVTPADHVLEVGAGLGVLTVPLLERAGSVTAVEKDDRLYAYLVSALGTPAGLHLVHADVLDLDIAMLLAGGITRVVANLPYVVASRLLVDVALAAHPPESMVVTVQKEVGERLAAAPGRKTYGALSVFAQSAFAVRIRKVIRPSCFFPPPQVDSTLVALERHPPPLVVPQNTNLFREMVKFAFSQRRKQLATIFRQAPPALRMDTPRLRDVLAPWNVAPTDRPESLPPAAFIALADALAPTGSSRKDAGREG